MNLTQTLDLILRCYFKICVNHPPTVFSSAVQQQGLMQQVGETVQNTDHAFHSAQSGQEGVNTDSCWSVMEVRVNVQNSHKAVSARSNNVWED